MAMATTTIRTLADLLARIGVPPDRIRFHPYPGTATIQDVLRVHEQEEKLCELVDGVLVEKTMGWSESRLAGFLLGLLNAFVIPRNLGVVTGADGTMEIIANLVRIPDVAFISWDRLPGRRSPTAPIPHIAPNLAVEVWSRSNTPAEMASKRTDYFAAGVQLVWEIHPDTRTVAVYSSPNQSRILGSADTLDGGSVLPGFTLPLTQLFAELDRQG